jgi:hypothetical protein
MDTQPTFGRNELLTHVVGGIAKAVSDRAGESRQQQLTRSQAAVHTIMEFRPGNAIEAILAGHCLMFHEMIIDSVHTTLRGEDAPARRATRANIVAMDTAFGNNLTRLEHYRHAEAVPETHDGTETEIADRVHRHQSGTPARNQAESGPSAAETGTILHYPSPPEAPDPGRSAQGMGTDQPGGAWGHTSEIQSAGPRAQHSSGAYRGNRQARRHPSP